MRTTTLIHKGDHCDCAILSTNRQGVEALYSDIGDEASFISLKVKHAVV